MDRDIVGLPPREITKLGICRSFQVSQVFMSETVFDNLTIAYGIAEERGFGLLRPLHNAERAAQVEAHIERFRTGDYGGVIAGNLPQGVRKLLDIAMATMRRPSLLLLDEPSAGIAPIFVHRMVEIMTDLKSEGQSVLVAESNDTHIAHILDRIFVIERGSIQSR